EHTRLRNWAQAAVAPRRVAQLEESTRSIANRLIDTIVDRGSWDFYRSFAYPFPLSVISSLLGFPSDAEERLHYWATCRSANAWGKMELAAWKTAARGVVEFYQFVEAEIVRRQT